MRIALDTNVLVSAIGTRGLCADLMRLVLGNHDVVVGERVLLELKRNLARKLRLPGDVIEQYDTFLRAQAIAAELRPQTTAIVHPAPRSEWAAVPAVAGERGARAPAR